jgi:hypothetical protein
MRPHGLELFWQEEYLSHSRPVRRTAPLHLCHDLHEERRQALIPSCLLPSKHLGQSQYLTFTMTSLFLLMWYSYISQSTERLNNYIRTLKHYLERYNVACIADERNKLRILVKHPGRTTGFGRSRRRCKAIINIFLKEIWCQCLEAVNSLISCVPVAPKQLNHIAYFHSAIHVLTNSLNIWKLSLVWTFIMSRIIILGSQ